MPALPASAPAVAPANPRRSLLLPASMAAIVLAVLLASFWYERYQPWALVLALVAFAAFADLTGLWQRNRAIALTILADILLIFAYLWSLDESVHVVINASGNTYTALVGGQTISIPRPTSGGRIGLFAGKVWDYRVQPTGEAEAGPPHTLIERFGEFIRFAAPKPAWTNVVVRSQRGAFPVRDPSQLFVYTGSWSNNRRGELEGDLSSSALVNAVPAGDYTISADLMRPDGSQGILVGVGPDLRGYVLTVRMDRPDATWFVWDRSGTPTALPNSYINVSTLAMIQRTVRLLLGNAVAGLLLLLLALPLYLVFQAFLRADRRTEVALRRLQRRLGSGRDLDVVVGLLAGVALVITALFAWGQLQGIPHVQDSVAYLFQAKTLALGKLSVSVPKPYAFFQEEFIDNYRGQWFGKYPPGWPLILAIGVLLRTPWLVNPVLAAVSLVLIYLIGREVYGRTVAALGAALALSSPFFLFLAGEYMSHTAVLFYATGFAYLAVRWAKRTEPLSTRQEAALLVPAGFLLGMAFITRQLDTIGFALPFLALAFWQAVRPRILALRWAVLGALAPVIFVLVYNGVLTGDPLRSPYSLWWPWDTIGFSDNIQSGFGPALGFWNTSLNLEYLMAHLFGWPFYFALGMAIIPFLLGRANRWDAIFGASALGVIAAYIFYWNPGTMYGPRYYYIAIPWFALLAGRGFEELYRWPMRAQLRRRASHLAALFVPALLLASFLAYNLAVYLPAQLPMYRGYNFVDASSLQAVARAHIHHALIFVDSNPPGEWWSYGSVFSANSPTLDGDIVYARDLGARNVQLMHRYPGREYYRLNGATLTRIQL
jgi:4-amino-4-deoxy-L-arabinose transferase-like glycosyltransferase